MNALRLTAGAALVAAAIGIVVQIAAGADYPTIPPGLIIVLVAAAACWWRRWWALLIPAVAALFLLVGGAIAPNTRDNLDAGSGRLWGTVLQLIALVVALIATVAAITRERKTP